MFPFDDVIIEPVDSLHRCEVNSLVVRIPAHFLDKSNGFRCDLIHGSRGQYGWLTCNFVGSTAGAAGFGYPVYHTLSWTIHEVWAPFGPITIVTI